MQASGAVSVPRRGYFAVFTTRYGRRYGSIVGLHEAHRKDPTLAVQVAGTTKEFKIAFSRTAVFKEEVDAAKCAEVREGIGIDPDMSDAADSKKELALPTAEYAPSSSRTSVKDPVDEILESVDAPTTEVVKENERASKQAGGRPSNISSSGKADAASGPAEQLPDAVGPTSRTALMTARVAAQLASYPGTDPGIKGKTLVVGKPTPGDQGHVKPGGKYMIRDFDLSKNSYLITDVRGQKWWVQGASVKDIVASRGARQGAGNRYEPEERTNMEEEVELLNDIAGDVGVDPTFKRDARKSAHDNDDDPDDLEVKACMPQ